MISIMLDYCNALLRTRPSVYRQPLLMTIGSGGSKLVLTVFFVIFIGKCATSNDYDDTTTVAVTIDGVDDVIDQSGKHVGDNVTLTCRVSSPSMERSADLQWRKSTVPGDFREETIAVGDMLTAIYAASGAGRYEVVLVTLPEITYYILHIYMVKHEDSGRIRCSLSNAFYARERDSAMLHVYKRPSVDNVAFDNYAEGSELTLIENIPISLTCRVHRTLPQPHLTLHIHNKTLGNHLPTNVSVNVYCPVDLRKTTPCPVHYDLDVAVTVPYLTATYRDDGQRMTCSVELARANWTPVISALHLNVLYRPRFNCSRSQSVTVKTRNVVIRCLLHYNPRPSMLRVRWRRTNDPTELALQVGSSILDRYSLDETIADVKSWKNSVMVFTITEVNLEDYGAYHFEAANDIGPGSHTIHLIQFHPPRTTTTKTTTNPTTTTRSRTSTSPPDVAANSGATRNSTAQFVGSSLLTFLLCLVAVYLMPRR